jgi:hypothetical protein
VWPKQGIEHPLPFPGGATKANNRGTLALFGAINRNVISHGVNRADFLKFCPRLENLIPPWKFSRFISGLFAKVRRVSQSAELAQPPCCRKAETLWLEVKRWQIFMAIEEVLFRVEAKHLSPFCDT